MRPYETIHAEKAHHPVHRLCEALSVSRSGYYAWVRAEPSERARQNEALLARIRAIHREHKGRYGSPRVHRDLRAEGECVGRGRVERLMRKSGIMARPARRFKRTTDSEHKLPVAPNRLERHFKSDAPNRAWVGDITYVWTTEGWSYLAVLLDLYSRKVVGWALGKTLSRDLAIRALERALVLRRPPPGLVHHTDRGSQYASRDYQRVLRQNGCLPSMSRAGDCWDNAVSESFFATLKKELVHGVLFATRTEAYDAIGDYIDNYYNARRRHSSIDYQIPNVLESQAVRPAA